ncbi:DUF2254 domain-containing protein [uncultured Roseobacter sp.]|uniref:DUF2254 domain-containing protein n=1 Tax=uncultured Roseobacter sp. TaxID=114847 RepID=UPI002617E4F4|nr:DUF2254 domain-containing protein [uncultured Roseobacter sp.]
MHRLKWPLLIFLRYYRNLGLRVTLYALLSVIVALTSPLIRRFLSDDLSDLVDIAAVKPILTIMASAMLGVSTFSLNVMVTAHRAAAASTTPRVHRLLLEDTTTQSVLSVFIGGFVYFLTAIVMVQAGLYPDDVAIVVMAVAVLVVVLIIIAMLRWIQHLSDLGSMDNSLRAVSDRTITALETLARQPALGANPITDDTVLPESTTSLSAPRSGYLQLIDVSGLQKQLPEQGLIYVSCLPGTHVLKGEIIAQVSGPVDDACLEALQEGFVFGDTRTYEQDATLGVDVLSEIAARALSPGINDPGTAIAVILRLKSVLWRYGATEADSDPPEASRVFVPTPAPARLIEAAFAQTARDGAGMIEVARHLRQSLQALAGCPRDGMSVAAADMAALALAYTEQANLVEAERRSLRAIEMPKTGVQ